MIISIAALTETLARLNPDALILLDPPEVDEDDQFADSDRTLYDMQAEDVAAVVEAGPHPGSLVGARVRLTDYMVTDVSRYGLTLRPLVTPGSSKLMAAHLRAVAPKAPQGTPRKRIRRTGTSKKRKATASRSERKSKRVD